MVKDKQPRFLFLMETKVHQHRMQLIRLQLGFKGMLAVDPVGLNGGIAFLWKDDTEVAIQNFSCRHINATIMLVNSSVSWKMMGFYGHPNRAYREES